MSKIQKIVITSLATILVILIASILILAGKKKEPIVGDFEAPAFDPQATVGVPENLDESLNFQMFSVEDKMRVGMCGNLTLKEDSTVDIYFTSDASNTFWAKVRLLDADGNVLGESGLIKAGEYVKVVHIDNPPKASTSVIAKILTYEENTYYSKGSVAAQVIMNVE